MEVKQRIGAAKTMTYALCKQHFYRGQPNSTPTNPSQMTESSIPLSQ